VFVLCSPIGKSLAKEGPEITVLNILFQYSVMENVCLNFDKQSPSIQQHYVLTINWSGYSSLSAWCSPILLCRDCLQRFEWAFLRVVDWKRWSVTVAISVTTLFCRLLCTELCITSSTESDSQWHEGKDHKHCRICNFRCFHSDVTWTGIQLRCVESVKWTSHWTSTSDMGKHPQFVLHFMSHSYF
jgi:hypothetical protein